MGRSGDLARIRMILETDREWAAFALADLSEEHHAYCQWHVTDGAPAVMLVYRGFQPPLFFALGAVDEVMSLIAEIADEPAMYVSVRGELLERMAAAGYRVFGQKTLYRMVLRQEKFQATEPHDGTVQLGPGDYEQLVQLFADGDATGEKPEFFQKAALGSGVYFGVREDGVLVATAGTHVWAAEPSVACLGNVYTRRDRRGRGLASVAAAAVTAELIRQGIRTIALNVAKENYAAVRVYERLGFVRYCEYREARVVNGAK